MPKTRFFPNLLLMVIGRLAINTSIRMLYPFLPALGRGLNVPIETIANLNSTRFLITLSSPILGTLSERYGRRNMVVLALGMFAVSSWIVVFWPTYWGLALTLWLTMIAKVIFDPAVHAYVADEVPYQQRGRMVAFVETSWAGGMFVGVPIVGLLIASQGWSSPFLWLGLVALVMGALLWFFMPHTAGQENPHNHSDLWPVMRKHPVLWAVVGYVFLMAFANDVLFINYGRWLEETYSTQLTSLGQRLLGGEGSLLATVGIVTGIIGLAELGSEALIALYVDKVGKRRFVLLACATMGLTYLFLPLTSSSLGLALTTIFVVFTMFELCFVSAMPIYGEMIPEARSVVLALVMGSMGLGRAVGTATGVQLWALGGIWLSSGLAAGATFVGLLLFYRFVHERKEWRY